MFTLVNDLSFPCYCAVYGLWGNFLLVQRRARSVCVVVEPTRPPSARAAAVSCPARQSRDNSRSGRSRQLRVGLLRTCFFSLVFCEHVLYQCSWTCELLWVLDDRKWLIQLNSIKSNELDYRHHLAWRNEHIDIPPRPVNAGSTTRW